MPTRRSFLQTAAAAGSIAILPMPSMADAHAMAFADGAVTVHPVAHASLALQPPSGTLYIDPVGPPAQYSALPPADLVLITHEHGDHLDNDTLAAVVSEGTTLITNQGAADKMAGGLAARAQVVGNGDRTAFGEIGIDVIPAYNTTEGRLNFHPQGRDNGYVLTIAGSRIYVSGDTEDIPEMRALTDIDLAFLCMNLPFTMDIRAAASAVNALKPAVVIPYHYRGRDGGTQDPIAFAGLLDEAIRAEQADWYGKGPGMA